MEKVKIKTVAKYGGHNINSMQSINLTLKFSYDTMPKYIQAIQMLNEDVTITAVIANEKIKLGVFNVHNITVDKDGAGKIKFTSQVDYVNLNNISALIGDDVFRVMLEAEIETDKKEDESN